MKSKVFMVSLLVGLAVAGPAFKIDTRTPTITKSAYSEKNVIYKGDHDIVSIYIPTRLDVFRIDDSSESSSNKLEKPIIPTFFIEADIDENGNRTYRGLYFFRNGKTKRLLDNGKDISSATGNDSTVYLAATDGLYTYSVEDKTAIKYGSLNISIKGIANMKDTLYILSEDNIVYEVTDNGTDIIKVDDVINAQEIVFDLDDNLYFSTPDKKIHVKTTEGIIDVTGLPENSTTVTLIKPLLVQGNGIPVLMDNVVYYVYSNGTSLFTGFVIETDAIPTAFCMQPALIQFYGYNKKIYEYDFINVLLDNIFDSIRKNIKFDYKV